MPSFLASGVPSSQPWLERGLDDSCDVGLRRSAVAFEPGNDTLPVGDRAVLRKLPFPEHARHGNLHTDDGAEHLLDIVGGRIADLPRIGATLLVTTRQILDHAPQPGGIVDSLGDAIGVNGGVVPGRHDLPCSCLPTYQLGET